MEKINLIKANSTYLNEVKCLLKKVNLPFEDIDDHFPNFIIAFAGNNVIGTAGIENYSEVALLRSFTVHENYRNRGIGRLLLKEVIVCSKNAGISCLYLLTTTAKDYFLKNGFSILNRDNLPESIKQSNEFQHLCPISAVCMYLKFDGYHK